VHCASCGEFESTLRCLESILLHTVMSDSQNKAKKQADLADSSSGAPKKTAADKILKEDKLSAFGVGDTERVLSVAFHPIKQYIAFGCENSSIKLWNIRSKLYAGIFTHHGSVNALEFSNDGSILATAASGHTEGNTIALWQCVHELKDEDELNLRLFMHDTELAPFRAEVLHQGTINALAFGPALGKHGICMLASASDDATVRVWQFPSGFKMTRQTLRSHKTKVTSCVFSEDGRYLISASIDGEICVHRLDLNDANADDSARFAGGSNASGGDNAQAEGASGGDDVGGEGGAGGAGDDVGGAASGSGGKGSSGAAKGASGKGASSGSGKSNAPSQPGGVGGAALVSSVEDGEQKSDEEEPEPSPDITFTHVFKFSCMEPVLCLRFFPDFTFTTLIGTSVKVNGPDREYLLCAGGAKSLMILRLRDGYLATDPIGKVPEALEDLATIERLTTQYAGDREVSYAMRKVNYSQLMIQQRIPMPEPVRAIACQRLPIDSTSIDDISDSIRHHSGYLEIRRDKRAILRSSWKRQYFVPNFEQSEISWYKNEELGDVPKGFLRFDAIRAVVPVARKRDPDGRQFRVFIYGRREPMYFRAASREERRTWIKVFDAGISSVKPNVFIVNACSGPSLLTFVIQSLFAPSTNPTSSQSIAEGLIRNVYSFTYEEIGQHDDYITALAAPGDYLHAKFHESHILESNEYMCVSASADQSVRAFVWNLFNPLNKKRDTSEASAEMNDQTDEDTLATLDFKITGDFTKPWIKLERPLTQQQLNSVVEEATEQATTQMMRVEVANLKPVTLGFPAKPDISRLGLIKIDGFDLDTDDEEFIDPNVPQSDETEEGDETAVMSSLGTTLLGPAAPVEGADLLVAAQVLKGNRRLTAAESVIVKAEARRELEEASRSPEEVLREEQRIADHRALGQLRSYARMLARQEMEQAQAAELSARESCNTDGCTIV